MPANNTGRVIRDLAAEYPRHIGWLISPDGWRGVPRSMPYALDNGAYGAFWHGVPWKPKPFLGLLSKAAARHTPPLWVVVPDAVGNRESTLSLWVTWFSVIERLLPGVPLAFAVQDGILPHEVPEQAVVIFVGGSTRWKWSTLRTWTANFPRVHVGRVNTEGQLWRCHEAGVESCDGTGWMRGGRQRLEGLRRYLSLSGDSGREQLSLWPERQR